MLPLNAQLMVVVSVQRSLSPSFTLQAQAGAIALSEKVESASDPPTEYEELDWGTDRSSKHALPSPELLAQSSEQSTSATPTAVDALTQVITRLHFSVSSLTQCLYPY